MVPESSDSQGIEKVKKDKKPFRPLALAWELGYTIAIPLVGFALLGRFIDKYLGTSPIFLFVGIIVSIVLTSFLVYWKTKDIMNG
jgi:F0F1-type ATP synthase assembly protein I